MMISCWWYRRQWWKSNTPSRTPSSLADRYLDRRNRRFPSPCWQWKAHLHRWNNNRGSACQWTIRGGWMAGDGLFRWIRWCPMTRLWATAWMRWRWRVEAWASSFLSKSRIWGKSAPPTWAWWHQVSASMPGGAPCVGRESRRTRRTTADKHSASTRDWGLSMCRKASGHTAMRSTGRVGQRRWTSPWSGHGRCAAPRGRATGIRSVRR